MPRKQVKDVYSYNNSGHILQVIFLKQVGSFLYCNHDSLPYKFNIIT